MSPTRELIRAARRMGWEAQPTRGGHLRFRHPTGATVHAASTPSDRRSFINTMAELRRALRRRPAEPVAGGVR